MTKEPSVMHRYLNAIKHGGRTTGRELERLSKIYACRFIARWKWFFFWLFCGRLCERGSVAELQRNVPVLLFLSLLLLLLKPFICILFLFWIRKCLKEIFKFNLSLFFFISYLLIFFNCYFYCFINFPVFKILSILNNLYCIIGLSHYDVHLCQKLLKSKKLLGFTATFWNVK